MSSRAKTPQVGARALLSLESEGVFRAVRQDNFEWAADIAARAEDVRSGAIRFQDGNVTFVCSFDSAGNAAAGGRWPKSDEAERSFMHVYRIDGPRIAYAGVGADHPAFAAVLSEIGADPKVEAYVRGLRLRVDDPAAAPPV